MDTNIKDTIVNVCSLGVITIVTVTVVVAKVAISNRARCEKNSICCISTDSFVPSSNTFHLNGSVPPGNIKINLPPDVNPLRINFVKFDNHPTRFQIFSHEKQQEIYHGRKRTIYISKFRDHNGIVHIITWVTDY